MNRRPEPWDLDQSWWHDNLSHTPHDDGKRTPCVTQVDLACVTSSARNFHTAIANCAHYRDRPTRLKGGPLIADRRYEAEGIADIEVGCDLLQSVDDQMSADVGYVNRQAPPKLVDADNAALRPGTRLQQCEAPERTGIEVNAYSGIFQTDGARICGDAYTARLELTQ